MKKFRPGFLWIFVVTLLLACQGEPGPVGPVGPAGRDGQDGVNIVGLMYEVEFDLNSGNEWSSLFAFPAQDEIFATDVVLVYILQGQTENGKAIWQQMPFTMYEDRGIKSINFDFTQNDVNIFLEASFNLNANTDHFDNEIARIVVVPADKSSNFRKGGVNYSDYYAVKAAYGLGEPKKLHASTK